MRRWTLILVAAALSPAVTAQALTADPTVIMGSAANDVRTGGAHDDALYGLAGDDRLDGGAGNDDLDGGPGADDLRGGAGDDAVSYADATGPVTVTLDDQANDGAPNEGDNVHRDVEDLYGGPAGDQLDGDSATNTIDGGAGDDMLTGGRGLDYLYGGDGADTIDARDGAKDYVDCGPGDDRVSADPRDVLATNCERRSGTLKATGQILRDWLSGPRDTLLGELRVDDLKPATASVTVRCHGGGCPFATRTFRPRGTSHDVDITPAFRGRHLRPGATVEVRISAPGAVGRFVRYTVRANREPSLRRGRIPAR